MCIAAAALFAATFVLYFCDFGLGNDLTALLKSFSATALISALSFLLFAAYRLLYWDNRKWLKAVLTIAFLLPAAVVLYFNWYNCPKYFDYVKDSGGKIWGYIMWANSVACAVGFPMFYIICVHFQDWSLGWDVPVTLLMMTFLPVILVVGCVVVSVGAVIGMIQLPGALIQKSVDNDLASRNSGSGTTYTVRHASGQEETVHSDNGHDFYGSDGGYLGHKD